MFDFTVGFWGILGISFVMFMTGLWVGIKQQYKNQYLYKGFRLVAIVVMLAFMFAEELILKPLRKVKIVILEKTIKRLNGYWTIGILVVLKTIEGLCKIILPFVAAVPPLMILVIIVDGVLGFISMNIIIHGHENLQEFKWYVKFVEWLGKLRAEVENTEFVKRNRVKVVEMRDKMKEVWGDFMFKIFGKRRPRGIVRYVRLYMRKRRNQQAKA